jgi:hypothetical protein
MLHSSVGLRSPNLFMFVWSWASAATAIRRSFCSLFPRSTCYASRTPINRASTRHPGNTDSSINSSTSSGSRSPPAVLGTKPKSYGKAAPAGNTFPRRNKPRVSSYLSLFRVPRGVSTMTFTRARVANEGIPAKPLPLRSASALLLFPAAFLATFAPTFRRGFLADLFASATARFLAAAGTLVDCRPSASLGFLLASTLILVALGNVLRLPFLLLRVLFFRSFCHARNLFRCWVPRRVDLQTLYRAAGDNGMVFANRTNHP